jgi:Tat protein secretion system quality control protein TatD with DNase activity
MATVDDLIALSQHPKFVGIGESGLDYHYTADSAGGAAAKPAHPHRGRTGDGPAAHHPCPRRR